MLPRVLEVEVMDTAEEAHGYDAMDHGGANRAFCVDLLARGPLRGKVLDVGTGTARIPIELCGMASGFDVVAVDLAAEMLAVARMNVTRAGLDDRVALQKVDAKGMPFADAAFAAVVSNSIVHHIPEPRDAIGEMWRMVAKGGRLFVRDLVRPRDEAELERLTSAYAAKPPEAQAEFRAWAHQRQMLRDSLHAALTLDEVRAIARDVGIPGDVVAATSDRHWTLAATK